MSFYAHTSSTSICVISYSAMDVWIAKIAKKWAINGWKSMKLTLREMISGIVTQMSNRFGKCSVDMG
jgi:hypothetical protein